MTYTSPTWTFLTNHTHTLLVIWRQPDVRVRDIAEQVRITERAVMRIIRELADAGFISISKQGRENRYEVVGDLHLRHPLEKNRTVGQLLEVLSKGEPVVAG